MYISRENVWTPYVKRKPGEKVHERNKYLTMVMQSSCSEKNTHFQGLSKTGWAEKKPSCVLKNEALRMTDMRLSQIPPTSRGGTR